MTVNNLYNNDWGGTMLVGDIALTGINMINDYLQGKIQGERAEFQARMQGAIQMTQAYNQVVPLYQQIRGQVKQMMHAQAMQYMNSGVDVSQGTAIQVINHTKEQGEMKINEIRDNVNTSIQNIQTMSSYQAQVGLQTGMMNGWNNVTNIVGNTINKYQQAGVFNTKNNTNTTGGNINATTTK